MSGSKQFAPAASRNRDGIAQMLARWLPEPGLVLEVASGTGEHAVYLAGRMTGLVWQPSDPDEDARVSIDAWRNEAALGNLRSPLDLDAAAAEWPIEQADAIVCINMVHISPWSATLGLFAGASRVLPPGAPLILYGPFRRAGVTTAPSNEAFDASLKARDPAWGLRDVDAMAAVSSLLPLCDLAEMSANNLMLHFRRR